ncbi:hypothetical protein [Numidum massiliense]|uniref:hypothetical protein n=1 Tax=Numidum massiliense TaxID=1522315 RepID=UPI00164DAA1E|nr:hypothetical protein [Numidum massiliense]
MQKERFRVTIQCNRCGEKYFLRGRKHKDHIETGFRRCLCDNDEDLEVKSEKM